MSTRIRSKTAARSSEAMGIAAHGFNISIAELDEAVTWQSATIGIAAVSASRDYLQGQMQQVEQAANRIVNDLGAQIADVWWQFVEES